MSKKELHRPNIYADRETLQKALYYNNMENMEMINDAHEEEMEKIKNDDYINRMNANAKNRRDDEESRARQQERMCKLKGEIEYGK